MSDAAPAPTASDEAAGFAPADAWARPLLERHLEVLGELAEIGLETARAIRDGAQAPGADPGAAAMAHARVGRAVRQAVMLRARLIQEMVGYQDRGAAAAAEARASAEADRAAREETRKARVQGIVERVARTAGEDAEEAERLGMEAGDRLEGDDVYGDVLSRPVSELVADICRDLGLGPDWARLKQEAWAREELAGDAPGAPLAALAAAAAGGPAPPGGWILAPSGAAEPRAAPAPA